MRTRTRLRRRREISHCRDPFWRMEGVLSGINECECEKKAADVEGNVEAKFNRMATDLGINRGMTEVASGRLQGH